MSLTNEENAELARLLGKIEWPVDLQVFYALCGSTVTTSIELGIIRYNNGKPEILLGYRHDKFFTGWHSCGSVVYPGQNAQTTIASVLKKEIGIENTRNAPVFVKTWDVMKGTAETETPRGQEVPRLFVVILEDDEQLPINDERKFFPVDELPSDLIAHHKQLIGHVRDYLQTNHAR